MFGRRSRRELEWLRAENLELRKMLTVLLWQGSCIDCAKKYTEVCTCLPGPDEPMRINCPHYTKAVIGK